MFKNRAVAAFVCIFALGVAATALAEPSDTVSFCAIASVAGAFFGAAALVLRGMSGKKFKFIAAFAFAVAAFSFGALRAGITLAVNTSYNAYVGLEDTVVLKVDSVDYYTSSCVIDGKIVSSSLGVSENTSARVRVYEKSGAKIAVGDTIEADVRYYSAATRDLLSDSVSVESRGAILSYKKGNGLFYSMRSGVSGACDSLFYKYGVSGVAKAVLIGDRSSLDPHLRAAYSNAGISHILAISGLHISLIASSLFTLLCLLGINRRIAGVIGALVSLLFAILVGFTPGAARAAFMMCILMTARAFIRRADGFTSVFIALFILLAVNPFSLFSVATQLSFLCCLGVILVNPFMSAFNFYLRDRIGNKGKFRRASAKALFALVSPAVISFAASVFSFPAAYASFNSVSYLSPLTNVFAIPLFTLGIFFAFPAVALYYIFSPAAKAAAFVAAKLFGAVGGAAESVYRSGVGSVSLKTPHMFLVLIPTLILFAVILFSRRKKLLLSVSSAALFIAVFVFCAVINVKTANEVYIANYSSGNNEYVYFAAGGSNVYVDMGGYRPGSDEIFTSGFTVLDDYVAASGDAYSAIRFDEISGKVLIRRVYIPKTDEYAAYDEKTEVINSIKDLAKARGCDIIEFDESDGLGFSNGKNDFSAAPEEASFSFVADGFSVRVFVSGASERVFCDAAIAVSGCESLPDRLFCGTLCKNVGSKLRADFAGDVFSYEKGVSIIKRNRESELEINELG